MTTLNPRPANPNPPIDDPDGFLYPNPPDDLPAIPLSDLPGLVYAGDNMARLADQFAESQSAAASPLQRVGGSSPMAFDPYPRKDDHAISP